MPDNNELVNMLRTVIQEELKPVRQELQQVNTRLDILEAGQAELRNDVQELRAGQHGINERLTALNERLTALEIGQQELKKGQFAIETAVNDLRAINRRTHKEIFRQLNAIWDDIKILSSQREKAVR